MKKKKICFLKSLKMVRECMKYTQRELEKRAGLPEKTVSQIESGVREPGIGTAKKLALALNCKVDDLL